MAKADYIPPFPSAIDRTAFGYWLAGFTDGEGSFMIGMCHRRNRAPEPLIEFKITVRADDRNVLSLIQSYWQCGRVNYHASKAAASRGSKPQCQFSVLPVTLLSSVIIPHFERFPLMAKKARDFAIWKEAVALRLEVNNRPYYPYQIGKTGRSKVKWMPCDIERHIKIMETLRHQRGYNL